MSKGVVGTIVEAVLKDDDFKAALVGAVEEMPLEDMIAKAVDAYFEEHPVGPAVDEAISEHDTVLNLVSRVEALEKVPAKFEPVIPVEELSEIPGEAASLRLVQDSKFNTFFARQHSGTWQTMHLYRITFHFPDKDVTRYVIAEGPAGAIDQATCGIDVPTRDWAKIRQATSVVCLPVMLRGWSDQQF